MDQEKKYTGYGYNLAMQEVSEFKLSNDKPKNAGKWLGGIKEINIDPKKAIPIKNIMDITQ